MYVLSLNFKPCPCWYFTIVFAIVLVSQIQPILMSFVAISVVFRHCLRARMSLVVFYPIRVSDTRMTSRESCVVCFEQYGAQFCACLYIFRDYYKLNE